MRRWNQWADAISPARVRGLSCEEEGVVDGAHGGVVDGVDAPCPC